MTPLRLQMIEDMKSAGLAAATQTVYIDAVRRLAAYYRRSPDQLSEEEVRRYLLGLRERGVALGTFRAYQGGIQFLYRRTLDRDWALFQKKEFGRPARKAEMLPTRYFHVTVTVPEQLRDTLRANQRGGYALLMKAAAEAIVELARDRRHVGATVGVLAVLHTWTQQLLYHPHVHCLVTGGGVSDDGADWRPARRAFLVPVRALAKLVRGKLRAGLQKSRPDLVLPDAVWSKPWVVQCTPWGEGEQAVLDYLARYVFRVAITNTRIVGLDDEAVAIRHKHRKSNRWRITRIPGQEFMRRFLQHVLPKGLHKVRYFGLWHPARRKDAARARLLLLLDRQTTQPRGRIGADAADPSANPKTSDDPRVCPCCRKGLLMFVRQLSPKWAQGP